MTEVVVYWACEDPKKYALGRDYKSEIAALQGGRLRNEYVVRVSYSLCKATVIREPTIEKDKEEEE